MYGDSASDTKIEEHLEESSICHDDYKRLKQENENYRQELHVLRRKLEINTALIKDLQSSGDALEADMKKFAQATVMRCSEKEVKYNAERKEYEDRIADLEASQVKCEHTIEQLLKDLQKYEDLVNKRSCDLTGTEDASIVELSKMLENETEMREKMETDKRELILKLSRVDAEYKELEHCLKKTREQLAEKKEELEDARETARELAVTLEELQSSNMTPASDTCKGNSLFAEVEDRRQMLLDKMEAFSHKYNAAKQELNRAKTEIKLLKMEKVSMARKMETDLIDTLQENAELLTKYKSRIFDLENKLKAEINKNDQMEEMQSTDDSFNYAQSLLAAKGKELKELNEKIEKQAMQMLVQDEVNYNLSRQLRYWQRKAMFLNIQVSAIKEKLKLQDTHGSKVILQSIEDCKFIDNDNFEKGCDSSSYDLSPDDTLCYENSDEENSTKKVSKEPVVDSAKEQKESKKFVNFASDTKDSESFKKSLKKQPKYYPVIVCKDDGTFSVS